MITEIGQGILVMNLPQRCTGRDKGRDRYRSCNRTIHEFLEAERMMVNPRRKINRNTTEAFSYY
jgi:hypothetical protein